MERKKQKRERKQKKRLFYAAGGAFILAAFLICAFFLPSVIFGLSDRYLWRDITLQQRETADIAKIDSTYEQSLAVRLENFAAGLAQERNYYVSAQEIELNPDIRERLERFRSEDGQSAEIPIWSILLASNLFPRSMLLGGAWPETIRQYVIYSDDYTEGVSFIIWAVDLTSDSGNKLTMLMDAQTLDLYGVKLDRTAEVSQEGNFFNNFGSVDFIVDEDWSWQGSLQDHFRMLGINEYEWWTILTAYYRSIQSDEFKEYLETWEKESDYGKETVWQGLNCLQKSVLFGENPLTLRLEVPDTYVGEDGEVRQFDLQNLARGWYPPMRLEICEICELIPEFSREP